MRLLEAKVPVGVASVNKRFIEKKYKNQLLAECQYELMGMRMEDMHIDRVSIGLCSDGAYLYLYSSTKGLFKIGTGCQSTTFGKIYAQRFGFRKGESGGSLFVFNRCIYYTSGKVFIYIYIYISYIIYLIVV